jgi:hypothetical protein
MDLSSPKGISEFLQVWTCDLGCLSRACPRRICGVQGEDRDRMGKY